MQRTRTVHFAMMILLAGLCAAIFAQTTGFELTNLDDNLYVTDNPALERGLSPAGLRWAFTTRLGNLWMPATWLSYLADHRFFGADPGAFHRTNLLLHLLNTLLVYLLLRRLTGGLWRAALIAALFAAHPLHVESVAWVAERKDVLSGFFFLLSLRLYVAHQARPGALRYLGALLVFALALMAKPMTVTLPVVLLLLDFRDPARRRPLRTILLEKIPFFALSAALSVITYRLVQTRDIGAPDPVPLLERVGQAVAFVALYLGKTFVPLHLSVFYPPEGLHFAWPRILVWAVLLIGLTGAAWQTRRRLGDAWLGWLWFLVMLAPVLGIVQGGMQLMSDRYYYLPSIGLFLAIATLLRALVERRAALRLPVAALAVAAVLAAAWAAHGQTGVWRNGGTLYRHALAVDQDNYLAHANLGVMLDDAGRSGEALPHLRRAVDLRGDPVYRFNLANALSHLGRYAEAVPYYRAALRLQPEFPTAHNNLGIALVNTGDWTAAGDQFRLATQQDPGYAGAWYNLGLVLIREGKREQATAAFARTLRLQPDHAGAAQQMRTIGPVRD